MTEIKLHKLTARQRQAWRLRYHYRWTVARIALRLGISHPAVVKLVMRAEKRAGLVRCVGRARMIKTKPRFVKTYSLSDVFEI